VRGLLHARGLRYRVALPVPGIPRRTIDVAFTRPRVALFIDGCFWHACPEHGSLPVANRGWWAAKIVNNQERDQATTRHLEALGWLVIRAWEHEAPRAVVDRVQRAIQDRVAG
jgi:DNA mismatch endonuclease (patch repair protein)